MAFRDTWHRALVYFGLAEDHEYYEDEPPPPAEPEEQIGERYRERPNVRRLSSRRRRDEIDDIFADDSGEDRRTTVLRSVPGGRNGGAGGDARVPPRRPQKFNHRPDVSRKVKDADPP